MPTMATESHLRQQKVLEEVLEEWQQKAKSGNRKPCMSIEIHVWQKKACVAIESRLLQSRLLQQTTLCGNRSHVWQQKAHVRQQEFMGGNIKLS
jgi:hypothetical protein